jgi:hypothetical protein
MPRARGRRGEALASPRDRQRLRERIAAERARVEGMLATVPPPNERDVLDGSAQRVDSFAMIVAAETPTACPVCGHGKVVSDEVMHGGTLRMSECLHCEHRWTNRPPGRWMDLGARMNRSIGIRNRQA